MKTDDLASTTTDRIESALADLEARITACRHLQMRLVTELDRRQVPTSDGARNIQEWAASRMDLAPGTAAKLIQTSYRLHDQSRLAGELEAGTVTFDRVVKESRLVAAGAHPELVERSRGWDLAGLRRLVARHQRVTRRDEQGIYQERFLAMQPALDKSS